jgi:excisionase family DNA binding protein
MTKKILSITEAAEYLGVFSLTLRNWEKKGLIKAFRTPGGHRRFKKSELDRIIGNGKKDSRLKETIEKLENIDFEVGSKKRLDTLISELKNISEES